MNSVANMTLSIVKQVVVEVKRGFSTWFSLWHPHSLLYTNGVLAALVGRDSSKVLGTLSLTLGVNLQ